MKKIFLLLNLFVFSCILTAQNIPDTQWTKAIDGGGWEWCYYAEQTSDGGYIMAGRTNARGAGNFDAWVVKTDENGDTIWTKTWGDTYVDEVYNVKQTSDGGYIICGTTTAFGWSFEGWLIRTDADGNTIWSKGYHPLMSSTAGVDQFMNVFETSDGGFTAIGFGAIEDAWQGWIVKVNSEGTVLWNKVYGDEYWERIDDFQPTSDGGYIAVGDKHIDHGGAIAHDGWLVKFDQNGDTLWARTFGEDKIEMFRSVRELPDGGYIICGEKEKPFDIGYDGYMVMTDASGNEKWGKVFGTGALLAVELMADGNFLVCGGIPTATMGYEAWIMKVDINGNELGRETIDLTAMDEMILSARKTNDGGYILAGRYNSAWAGGSNGYGEFWLVKLTPENNPAVITLSENFDTVTTPFLPAGWTGLLDVMLSNTAAEVKTTEHGGAPSSPNAVFIMNGLDGSIGQVDPTAFVALVSPLVQIGSNGDTLKFWGNGGNSVVVGTLTDPDDASTFTEVQEIPLTFDFTEYTIVLNTPGNYHIAFKNGNGNMVTPIFIDQITLTSGGITGIEDESEQLKDYTLEQNYPNPFNPSTTIRFSLTNNSKVNLTVYDALGKEIIVLIDRNLTAGTHEVNFNAAGLNSGVYFYRINVSGSNENYTSVRKMIFMK